MIDFFRSRAARELADILLGRQGSKIGPYRQGQDVHSDDLEYFTLRCSKQVELAGKARSPAAREAHLTLADLLGARAREAMAAAMRSNARSSDVRPAPLLRLDTELDLNEFLGAESAERFRSL